MKTSNPKPKTLRHTLVCLAACAASVVSMTSFAASPSDEVLSVRVRYSDLNLSTPEGSKALYRRIEKAARDVCPDAFSRDFDVRAASERCQAVAVAHAVNAVNSPQLALLHAAHNSRG